MEENNSSTGNAYKSAIDYKSTKVNLGQILTDFRSTITAIGAPNEVEQEVGEYLKLVEIQAQKPAPSVNIIKSNLKNSAEILDEYITKTLNRNSKVVKNWVDALFLQNVDYKISAKQPVKEDMVKSAEHKTPESLTVNQEQTLKISKDFKEAHAKSKTVTDKQPKRAENFELKNLLNKFKQDFVNNKYNDALLTGEKALKLAKIIDNKPIQAKLYLNMAYIYDDNNNLSQALTSYNNALNLAKSAGNDKIQAKAHYNMASIYDELGKNNPALDHYYASLAFDGAVENVKGQAQTLNNIGNIYTAKKDYKSALDYYKLSFGMTKDLNDKAGQAAILSNVAGIFRDLGQDKKAINYYKDSIKLDMGSGNLVGCAKSYEQAGNIMLKNGHLNKAENLYKKSLAIGREIGDKNWCSRIAEKIDKI